MSDDPNAKPHPEQDHDPYVGSGFRSELRAVINRYSMENRSNTPDYILAAYLTSCLVAFDTATRERSRWYGHKENYISGSPPDGSDLRIAEPK